MIDADFHGLSFLTEPGRVFTPRPSTEHLVDAALDRIGGDPARVADVGTGAGVVAITLALQAPNAEVWASDSCPDAVELARRNAERLGARVQFVEGDLLDGLPRQLDLIVANLPYLPAGSGGYAEEPPAAVFSGPDGLDHYRRLLAGAAHHLGPDGGVLIQFHGSVLEADRTELPWLSARLESLAGAAQNVSA
jgi:release factor glutamine methyltransferase